MTSNARHIPSNADQILLQTTHAFIFGAGTTGFNSAYVMSCPGSSALLSSEMEQHECEQGLQMPENGGNLSTLKHRRWAKGKKVGTEKPMSRKATPNKNLKQRIWRKDLERRHLTQTHSDVCAELVFTNWVAEDFLGPYLKSFVQKTWGPEPAGDCQAWFLNGEHWQSNAEDGTTPNHSVRQTSTELLRAMWWPHSHRSVWSRDSEFCETLGHCSTKEQRLN